MQYNIHEDSLSNLVDKKEEKRTSEILGYQDIYISVIRLFYF